MFEKSDTQVEAGLFLRSLATHGAFSLFVIE